jgi:hypothetical protein
MKYSSLNSQMLCQVYKALASMTQNHVGSWTQSERHVAQESISRCLSSLLLKTYSYSYDAVKLLMDFRRNLGICLFPRNEIFIKVCNFKPAPRIPAFVFTSDLFSENLLFSGERHFNAKIKLKFCLLLNFSSSREIVL